MADNCDDFDFVPTSNSNLASLFDASGELSDNPTLIYTAPKQPKKPSIYNESRMKEKKPESKVICALIATVWKWSNHKYESVGKLGVAIIGSDTLNSYDFVIYKTKTNVMVQMRINTNFQITVNIDNFVTFCDNSRQNWLIKFNSEKDFTTIIESVERYGGKIIKKIETQVNENSIEQQQPPPIHDNKIEENRADILTKIAKLGQSILPNQDPKTNIEEIDDNSSRTKQDIASISRSNDDRFNQSITPSHSITTPIQTRQNLANSTSFIMNSSMTYDPFSILFTENRTHNSEVRSNLNQITEKLNQVLQYIVNDKQNNDNYSTNEDLLKSKIKVLQLKIENLNRELEENTNKIGELQQESNEQEKIVDKLQQRTDEFGKAANKIGEIQQPIVESRYFKTTPTQKELFVAKIKQSMSDMYDDIRGNFDTNSANLNVIAQSIKQTTRKIIQQYQEIHNSD